MADEQDRDETPDSVAEDDAAPAKPEQGTLTASSYDADDVFENPEPWEPIETKLVVYSFAAAVVFLVIFAILIHKFVLN